MNAMRAACFALAVLAAARPGTAVAEERIFRVAGDESWTDTGLRVRAGDLIEIRASGTIDWGKGEIGPEGTSGGGSFRPLASNPAGGLIGRISGGEPFFLGDDARLEATTDGRLELGINDDKVSDNSGEFRVRVRTDSGSGTRRYSSGFGGGDEEQRDGTWTRRPDRDDRDDRYDHEDERGGRSERGDRYRHRDPHGRGERDTFWWRGRVDGTDELILQGRTLRVKHLTAEPIQRQDHEFSGPIPEREADFELEVVDGRGRVRLLQKPDRSNDWTAVILLDDSDDGGSSNYELELSWRRSRSSNDTAPDGMFRWRGKVDIGCRISISGKKSTLQDEGGRGSHAEFADFTSALPASEVPVSLRKVRGRGKVRLVDSPRPDNGYTAVVEIEDDKGGSDTYEFEIGWRN